jgi:hypothetical protein
MLLDHLYNPKDNPLRLLGRDGSNPVDMLEVDCLSVYSSSSNRPSFLHSGKVVFAGGCRWSITISKVELVQQRMLAPGRAIPFRQDYDRQINTNISE